MITDAFRAAIGGMANIKQFFVWGLQWNAAENKYEKMPVYDRDYGVNELGDKRLPGMYRRSGDGHNNPAFWMTLDDAAAAVATLTAQRGSVHALGFSLTRDTGYWFLDVDKCFKDRHDTSCHEAAAYLYSALSGAFYERSSSGTGFHIIGRGTVPEHSTKCGDWGLEFYTDGRGIAFDITGAALGNADTDHSAALSLIVPHYFKPSATVDATVSVRTGPRDDWNGPRDDNDLLRRALQSSSTGSLFGNKASFADLWNCNVERLRLAYPDLASSTGYGESEVDMALAAHLAFWTGCDVDRIDRLMRQSALRRAKWDDRRPDGTWLRHTILRQCAKQGDVIRDKPVEPPPAPIKETITDIVGTRVDGRRFLNADEQIELFKGCVYVRDVNRIYVPTEDGYDALDSARFNVTYGGYSFVLDIENGKTTRDAWEAFTQTQLVQHKRAHTTRFRPTEPARSISNENGVQYLNTWVPPIVYRVKGDASPFTRHIAKILPNGRDQEIFISYLAACVQYPGVKFGWCPVLQGAEGNGKTTLARIMQYAIGRKYVHTAKAASLGSNFNAWTQGKLFVIVNDVHTPGGREDFMESLKPLVTDGDIEIEGKGRDQVTGEICFNLMMSMNRKNGIRKTKTDRRYAIFYTAHQHDDDVVRSGMGDDYFNDLNDWLNKHSGYAIVADYLATLDIEPDLNPATRCRRAPATSTLADVLRESRGPMEQALDEAIEFETPGFIGGYVSWSAFRNYMQGQFSKATLATLESVLESSGYVPHPAMGHKGMSHNPIGFNNFKKDRIYVLKTRVDILGLSAADAVRNYEKLQMATKNVT